MKNISAFTPATYPYPPYINVSQHTDTDGIRVTVRSKCNEDGSCGFTSFIDLTADEYQNLLNDLIAYQKL